MTFRAAAIRLAFLLFACGVLPTPVRGAGREPLEINPAPRWPLVIAGEKDPRITLTFSLYFAIRSEACRTTLSRFLWSQSKIIGTAPAGATEFRFEFHLDKYLPGTCDWQPSAVMFCSWSDKTRSELCSPLALVRQDAALKEARVKLDCQHRFQGRRPSLFDCMLPSSNVPAISTEGATIELSVSYPEDQ